MIPIILIKPIKTLAFVLYCTKYSIQERINHINNLPYAHKKTNYRSTIIFYGCLDMTTTPFFLLPSNTVRKQLDTWYNIYINDLKDIL